MILTTVKEGDYYRIILQDGNAEFKMLHFHTKEEAESVEWLLKLNPQLVVEILESLFTGFQDISQDAQSILLGEFLRIEQGYVEDKMMGLPVVLYYQSFPNALFVN